MKFLESLDSDLRSALIAQLRDLWSHNSTAIEGNTLTLGETKFVIEEGLTVSGKPLKDHQEVIGHARAIDLVYDLVGIHPFYDGNDRLARLVSNVPVLKSGHPPILIPVEKRQEYIQALVTNQLETGVLKKGSPIMTQGDGFKGFERFCSGCWKNSLEVVDKAHRRQAERDRAPGLSR